MIELRLALDTAIRIGGQLQQQLDAHHDVQPRERDDTNCNVCGARLGD